MELLKDNTDLFEIQCGISHFYYKMKITKKIKETALSPFTGRYFTGCDTTGSWQVSLLKSIDLIPFQNHSLYYCHRASYSKKLGLWSKNKFLLKKVVTNVQSHMLTMFLNAFLNWDLELEEHNIKSPVHSFLEEPSSLQTLLYLFAHQHHSHKWIPSPQYYYLR